MVHKKREFTDLHGNEGVLFLGGYPDAGEVGVFESIVVLLFEILANTHLPAFHVKRDLTSSLAGQLLDSEQILSLTKLNNIELIKRSY